MALTFERSPDTDAIVSILRGCNNEISYRDIARQAGLTYGRMRQVLQSAKRILRSENILFGTVWGEGLRRLTDSDIVKKPDRFWGRTIRGAKRELKDQDMIGNYSGLSIVEQNTVQINRIKLHAVRQQAAVKLDTKKVETSPLPMPNVAQLVSGRKN